MSLPVIWTLRGRCDLEAIHAWVASAAPIAAERLKVRLVEAADSLQHLPERNRAVGQMRELVIVRPYILRYRVMPDAVLIVRIRHGARQPIR